MTASNRDLAITITLQWEGGYGNDPTDPGGPTNWGITIWDARKYWKPKATSADVRAMPKSVAIDIYRQKYWKTAYYDCDHLVDGVDLSVFDYGVNSGPSRAHKALMASIGGPANDTINRIYNYRMGFLRRLGTWSHFGRGWTSRVNGIKAASLRMAAAAAATQPTPIPTPKEPPVTTPAPAPSLPISIDAGSILQLLLNNLPALLAGVGKFYPPLAPLVAVVTAVKDAMVKIPASDGSLAAIEKIVAAEMYAVAISLDPTLAPKA